jgi:maltose O-acetyltransferase
MKHEIRRIARDVVLNSVFSSSVIPTRWRWRLYRFVGLPVRRSYIAPGVFIGSRQVFVGAGTFLNSGCFIDGAAQVRIGANVSLGMRTMIITGTHKLGSSGRRADEAVSIPVTIEDGCWIGANVTILPGVSLGRGSVVGAGSVVTKSLPPNSKVAGSPARPIGQNLS